MPPTSIGTLICSYGRPQSLVRALGALEKQVRAPDQVVVVIRDDDYLTAAILSNRRVGQLPISIVVVSEPGTVHALNAGLDASHCDVVAITDDDTAPWPTWLERMLAHFQANPRVGGVGGRDFMHEGGIREEGHRDVVGKVQWFGRIIGNHHLGSGDVRPVDVLKGANMAYRLEAIRDIRFDRRLRGSGAQPAEDVTFSMAVRNAGWTLLYDPAAAVEHYTGERTEARHYSGITKEFDAAGMVVFGHNEAVCLLSGQRSLWKRAAFLGYSAFVGTKVSPGLLQAVVLTPRLGLSSWRRYFATQRGKLAGVVTMLRREPQIKPLVRHMPPLVQQAQAR